MRSNHSKKGLQTPSVQDIRRLPDELLVGAGKGLIDAMEATGFAIPAKMKIVLAYAMVEAKEPQRPGSIEIASKQ